MSYYVNNTEVIDNTSKWYKSFIDIPSGSTCVFVQTSAPTGWTKLTTHNDKSLRVVNGTAGSGGTVAFSSVFGSIRQLTGTIGSTTATNQNTTTSATVTYTGDSIAATTATATVSLSGGQDVSAVYISGTVSCSHTVGTSSITVAQTGAHTHSIGYYPTINEGAGTFSATNPGGSNVDNLMVSTSVNFQQTPYIRLSDGEPHTHTRPTPPTATFSANNSHTHTITNPTVAFTGNSHTHTIASPTASFTGTPHTHTQDAHTHTFTGTSVDFRIKYIDTILATKD